MAACVGRDDRRLRNAPLSMPEASLLQPLCIQLASISLSRMIYIESTSVLIPLRHGRSSTRARFRSRREKKGKRLKEDPRNLSRYTQSDLVLASFARTRLFQLHTSGRTSNRYHCRNLYKSSTRYAVAKVCRPRTSTSGRLLFLSSRAISRLTRRGVG